MLQAVQGGHSAPVSMCFATRALPLPSKLQHQLRGMLQGGLLAETNKP